MIMHTFVVLAYKESQYLEDCIQSVLNQTYKSRVIVATSTPNEYIATLARKYDLDVKVNMGQRGIGYDFDFAWNCGETELVTIAHQDDIYDREFAQEVVKAYSKQLSATILFTDYYEIKNNQKVYRNLNLNIKRILLAPLLIPGLAKFQFVRRRVISLGSPISCPAVTFVPKNLSEKTYFASNMKCDIDWLAWERISREKGMFVFVNKHLMGHRVHEESTTTAILEDNIRTKEDFQIFCLFWPKWMATGLTRIYRESEKNNQV